MSTEQQSKGWTASEEAEILRIQTERGVTRIRAIQIMRARITGILKVGQ